ncbi:Thymidine kinase [Bombilactobacillus mellis]|uniref:Thymidine kinase n=1 Tax=Bombilactobacillus mellis TaxID=1218508 RepID=A0A0F4KRJ3_9LACO|nr:thymidine kinase [Bombilactobacillus mellis]MBI0107376.1 thymidine kinase [Lactobacillus sp. W8086]MBI0108841.1 thymidine kinase [Lactobacillus sp. W8085]MBI0112058.1 thymidine kinase [Lactobacillus sp. W8088]MBI0115774.1 thymidine kinase [Lactobacillus sp. W8087]MBI0119498.1 thymidine kinase [Lactobacillus sp. W8089]MBI0131464.1 thymidine kinase [Lactobacillus sp. W8090]
MAQLFFRYGAMNAGKSIEVLKVAHNYEEQGKQVLLMTSSLDTRNGQGQIASRIGLSRKAVALQADTNIYTVVQNQCPQAACILIDEAQFLTVDQVKQAAAVVDELGIPVMAFGLKNDSQNHLFAGSEALLIYADKIEEMKTICWFCRKKATMNLRITNGQADYGGEQIQIGGNESYYPVCRKHYLNPPLDKI